MTGESYSFNNGKSEVKYPAIKQNDYPEIAEKYITKDALKNSENSEKSNKNTAEKEPFLKCRYLVIFMGFLVNFQINCYRLNTSISIVAMVNKSVAASNESIDLASVSCPSNEAESKNNSTNERAGEFDWSPEIQGYVLGSSFLGYVITQMPGGMMAEKISAKVTIIIGVFISSVCQLISPFASWSSSYFLIGVQFIRGIGQGLIPAATCVLAANWLPINERGLLNTVMMSGFCVGALLGGVATGALCSSSIFGGWPSVYYIFGVSGVVFSLFLQLFLFESPKKHPRITNSELKYILQNQENNFEK
ncbi:putative inorganic phosphate cotransporter, partial [Trichonephila clavata]